MNKVVLLGRLTKDPEVRRTENGGNTVVITRYSLAVDRRFKRDGEPSADFINCVSFGRAAEFAEKYYHKGSKICISGRIQTGSYTNKDGQRVYTTEVVVEEQDFAESKSSGGNRAESGGNSNSGGYSNNKTASVPDPEDGFPDLDDDEIPFA